MNKKKKRLRNKAFATEPRVIVQQQPPYQADFKLFVGGEQTTFTTSNESIIIDDPVRDDSASFFDTFRNVVECLRERLSERFNVSLCGLEQRHLLSIRWALPEGYELRLYVNDWSWDGKCFLCVDLRREKQGDYEVTTNVTYNKVPAEDPELVFNLVLGELRRAGL